MDFFQLMRCIELLFAYLPQKQLDFTFKKDNNKKVEKMRITDSKVEYPNFNE